VFTSPNQVVPGRKLTRHRGKASNLIEQHGDRFMQTRRRIALLTAGLLVGAQIGIAAIETPIADTSDQMEPIPSEALALEGGTSGEPMEAQSEATPAPDENAQAPIAAAEEPSETVGHSVPQGTAFPPSTDDVQMLPALVDYLDRTAHLRLTGASGNVFPPSTDDQPMLPATIAYLDSTAHLRLTGASGNVFPPSTDDQPMLPALVAYLEQREATRLASQTQPQITGDATTADESLAATSETAVTTPDAREPARDVSLIDRILPQTLRDLF
jgi:hypothetical protein